MLNALQIVGPFLVPVSIVALLLLTVGRPNMGYGDGNEGWWFLGGLCAAVVFLIWAIAVPVTYLETTSLVAEMEAFNAETRATYEYTINETERIVLTDDTLTEFSDQAASERIGELRDRVEWYNANLYKLEKYEAMPFIGAIVRDANHLQPIVLE